VNGRIRRRPRGAAGANPSRVVALLLLAGAAPVLTITGCATSGSGDPEAVNNGLSQIDPDLLGDPEDDAYAIKPGMSQDEIARRLESMIPALDDYFGSTPGGTASSADDAAPVVTEADPDPEPEPVVAVAEPEPEAVPPAPPEPTPEERAHRLASELEAVLRESADDPYVLAIRLAGLLAGEPDAAQRLAGVIDRLPEDQRAVASAVAEIIAAAGVSADGDPQRLTDALVEQAQRLDEARPVRIGRLAMCSRVEGFGRFTELPSSAFVAGTPMRMVVYAEVEHFDSRPATPEKTAPYRPASESGWTEWEVRLSMEVQLYHEADGLLAWRLPEEVTAYRSRTKMRDFFVVNRIELPRSLTVGAYRLKVIIRDLADRSVDERIVPIRVVADPKLTRD
jgi:hypothetical protein